ncbi:GNAT family N-acetyltransferase [Actinoplanes sp. N902-109]|uniref:GNAT family N-acetyltransferase n=1 Tax=Actinoplanes sp. (strain N902-109) TaxID=649831 RepID=UPI0003293773|nr:GNAT family N-acetyltransferase [Actinoplanes sp. N902-109]AGL18730.1 GCN5-like N-acetyltransferase [Actinoplanes sp. N902-109]
MTSLERLTAGHADALLAFERDNRAWFARFVTDRGDAYFAGFAGHHAAMLAEQDAGTGHFHLLVTSDGAIIGRFNLFDVHDGQARLGYRVAERFSGRGLAKEGVRQVIARARTEYRLRRLTAGASPGNAGSLAVLRGTGFTVTGPDQPTGRWHVLDL